MKPFLIGIAGPSSSGKSELSRCLCRNLPDTGIVSLDSYYRGMEEIPLEARKQCNFDHPDSLEWELLLAHLQDLRAGRAIEEPVYSFEDYCRTAETRTIQPRPFLIVEGLFMLYWPELRDILDLRVYVDAPDDVCLARRLARDVVERGRTRQSVLDQYARTVRPSAEKFVRPTMRFADVIVSGEQALEASYRQIKPLLLEDMAVV